MLKLFCRYAATIGPMIWPKAYTVVSSPIACSWAAGLSWEARVIVRLVSP
jgi:hypothetical protein